MSALEFRVRWRREGRQGASAIYQTEEGALTKAERLLALDAVKEGTRFGDMPDLAGPPTIEHREVGPWTTASRQVTEADDDAVVEMEEWVTPGSHSGIAFAENVF